MNIYIAQKRASKAAAQCSLAVSRREETDEQNTRIVVHATAFDCYDVGKVAATLNMNEKEATDFAKRILAAVAAGSACTPKAPVTFDLTDDERDRIARRTP